MAIAEGLAGLAVTVLPREPTFLLVHRDGRLGGRPDQHVGVVEGRRSPMPVDVDLGLARGELEVEVQRPFHIADGLVQ